MTVIKEFRKVNHLLQKDLADFLGVSREFISMAESGKAPLPYNHLCKLRDNDKGWDVSMFTCGVSGGDHIEQNGGRGNIGKIAGDSGEVMSLRKENEMLRAQVEELKAQNEKYWNMIERLTGK
ncbi:MAG: helix-turn-helix domain-containing protein [Bacteroidales bacterium]|nr:helix-turn-helix domain-containing protein [Bacteroidales bacterium]